MPGAIVILTCAHPAGISMEGLGLLNGVIFIAAAWVVGFIVQGLGEARSERQWGRLIYYGPIMHWKEGHKQKWPPGRTLRAAFRAYTASPEDADQRLQYERFVVIKEACGNMAVAIVAVFTIRTLFTMFAIAGTSCLPRVKVTMTLTAATSAIPYFVIGAIALGTLHVMNVKHAIRQFEHLTAVLELKGVKDIPINFEDPPTRVIATLMVAFAAVVVAAAIGVLAGSLTMIVLNRPEFPGGIIT